MCKLCGVELEDAEHAMLRCGEYDEERRGLKAAGRADRCLNPTGVVGMDHGRRWRKGRLQLLVDIMRKRAELMKQQEIVSGMRM